MTNKKLRQNLDTNHPNATFDDLLESKMRRKRLTREEALKDIIEIATKTNPNVDNELGGIIIKYDYTLAPEEDSAVFASQCEKLAAEGYALAQRLLDVDGSITSTFTKGNAVVVVSLDYYVGATYIESDSPLAHLIVRGIETPRR